MLKRILGALVAIAFAWSLAVSVATPARAQPFQADNVQMSVSGAPGTSTITLNAAVADHQSFAAVGVPNGDTVCYYVQDSSNAWELDHGTYTVSGTTLTRGLLWSSTGSLLSLSSAATVSIVTCAEDTSVPSGHIAVGEGTGYLLGDSGFLVNNVEYGATIATIGNM